jgi:hypothetical protein
MSEEIRENPSRGVITVSPESKRTMASYNELVAHSQSSWEELKKLIGNDRHNIPDRAVRQLIYARTLLKLVGTNLPITFETYMRSIQQTASQFNEMDVATEIFEEIKNKLEAGND